MGMGGMGGGDFPTAIIEGPPGPPGSKGNFSSSIALIVTTMCQKTNSLCDSYDALLIRYLR